MHDTVGRCEGMRESEVCRIEGERSRERERGIGAERDRGELEKRETEE
jgi:hypothetical protein